MKNILFILFFLCPAGLSAQTDIHKKYYEAEALLHKGKVEESYKMFRKLEQTCPQTDTMYNYILWYAVGSVSELEHGLRMSEKFTLALPYSLEALSLIEKGKSRFDEPFSQREAWMIKNIVVNYFGLEQFENARKYQDRLYKMYKDKTLPSGIDDFYNFKFFKWKNNNVWGYEWYPELGDPQTEGSFSKIVFYIYSTKPDGTDKEQLFRLHVLKFHKLAESNSFDFDYLLTRRAETATEEVGGTYLKYNYKKQIDYKKLISDVLEILNGDIQPDTKSVRKKN